MFDDRQYIRQLITMETVTMLMQIVIEETQHRTELVLTPSDREDQLLVSLLLQVL